MPLAARSCAAPMRISDPGTPGTDTRLAAARSSLTRALSSDTQDRQVVPARSRCPICCGEVKRNSRITAQMLLRPTPKQQQTTAPTSAERWAAAYPTSSPARSLSSSTCLVNKPARIGRIERCAHSAPDHGRCRRLGIRWLGLARRYWGLGADRDFGHDGRYDARQAAAGDDSLRHAKPGAQPRCSAPGRHRGGLNFSDACLR